jgi:hypothetical protein
MGDAKFATDLKEYCVANLVRTPDRRVARKCGPRILSPGLSALTSRENFNANFICPIMLIMENAYSIS